MHKKKKKVIPRDLLIGCIKVTYEMVNDWIVELRTMGIRYIVAPYEADPQLAYLCKKNIASAAISEDSDLIVFKCNEVLFKLDLDSSFIQIKYDNIFKIPSMKHMTPDKFIEMCILSGCDYLPSPKRVGIKTAYNLLKTMSASELFEQWDLYPDDPKVPERCPDYSVKFYLAKFAFYHQFVYDDETNKVVNLNPIDPNQTLPNGYNIADIIGHMIDPKIAEGVAKGFLNPITHEPFIHNVKIPPQLTFDSFIIPSKPSFNKVLPKNSESLSDNILKTIPLNAVEHFSSSDVSLLNAADISNTNDTTRSQVHTVKSSFFVKLSQLNKINASPINSNSLNTSPINSNSLNTFQSISDPPSNLNSIESIDNSNSRLGDIRSYLSQMKFTEKKVLATESNTSKISYSEQKKINKPSVLRTTKIPFKPKCRYTTSRHSKDNSLNQETYSSDPSTLSLETESKINILSDTNESPVKQFAVSMKNSNN